MTQHSRRLTTAVAGVGAVALIAAGLVLAGSRDSATLTQASPAAPPAQTASTPSTSKTDATTTKAVLDGPRLPAIKAASTQGTLNLAKLDGPAVLHIYASWCPTCKADAAGFSEALQQAPKVKPYFIAVQDTPSEAADFAREYGWRSGPRIDDPEREVASALGLQGQPNTVVIDRTGATKVFAGPVDQATLTALLRSVS